MKMTLDDYIKKYGEESGTKRYYGMVATLEARAKTYESHPFKRLTKEWFIWRYPEDGLERFNEHVAKSKHSLENFIQRYGQELGQVKYEETISKKNTVKLVREKLGDAAEEVIKTRYTKSLSTRRSSLEKLTEEQRNQRLSEIGKTISKTKKERYGGKRKIDLFTEQYGDDGPKKYGEYLQAIFKSIGSSKEATKLIEGIISDNEWLLNLTLHYRNSDGTKSEWFLSDKTGLFFYDFVVKEAKVILEYDGSKWHPTEEQVESLGEEIMDVTGLSYIQAYQRDMLKLEMAIRHGYDILKIRSDDTKEQQELTIRQFLELIKIKCNINQ